MWELPALSIETHVCPPNGVSCHKEHQMRNYVDNGSNVRLQILKCGGRVDVGPFFNVALWEKIQVGCECKFSVHSLAQLHTDVLFNDKNSLFTIEYHTPFDPTHYILIHYCSH